MKTGFENGGRVGVEDFPFDALDAADRGNPLQAILETPTESILSDPRFKALLDKLTRVVAMIEEAKNSKMSAAAFLIAIGDEAMAGRRMTVTARRNGVTKAAVSKTCVEWCEYLGKKPSESMRREAAKLSFQQSNVRRKKNERKST